MVTLSLIALWYQALFVIAPDRDQGEVYRLIYVHVPMAFAAFVCAFILFWHSIRSVRSASEASLRSARASAEVGLIFTVLTLATGSIWGHPVWGTWWTWDARLTTTFILALLYAGYLAFYSATPPSPQRTRACSVIGILIFVDIPIIYKSVTWWRTLHQPPTLMRPGGSTIDPDMRNLLISCVAAVVIVAVLLVRARSQNLELSDALEDETYRRMQ